MRVKVQFDLDRLLGHCDIGDCWEWTLSLNGGYARAKVGSTLDGTFRHVYVHRFVYESLVGPVPNGLDLDHLCRNRKCCNPDHLEPVTRSENARRGLTGCQAGRRLTARTHCPEGHEFTSANTFIYRSSRRCRSCAAAYQRRRRSAA